MAARTLSELLESVGVPQTVGGHLAQAGVKGMKWGVRKPRGSGPGPASKAAPPKRFDKKAPKPVTQMSDKELKKVLDRMRMEQQFKELSKPQMTAGQKFIKDTLVGVGKQQASALANQAAKAMIDAMLKGAAKGAGNAAANLLPYLKP